MKIEAIAALMPASPAVVGPLQAAAWRQALEEAQADLRWQMRVVEAGDGQAGKRARAEMHAMAARGAQAVAFESPASDGGLGPVQPIPHAPRGAPPAAVASATPGGQPSPVGLTIAAHVGLSQSRVAGHATPANETPTARPPALVPQMDNASWPATHGAVHINGQQVSATLRDQRLTEAQAQSLRRALDRQLARAGLALAELRVNGQPVTDTPRS